MHVHSYVQTHKYIQTKRCRRGSVVMNTIKKTKVSLTLVFSLLLSLFYCKEEYRGLIKSQYDTGLQITENLLWVEGVLNLFKQMHFQFSIALF